jgi:hypothetical protein
VVLGSIADEVVMLALYPDNDGWPVGADGLPRVPSYLRAAVSVALLADLAVAGAIAISGAINGGADGIGGGGERVSGTGRGVLADAESAALAARIAARPGQTADYWVAQIYAGEPQRRRLVLLHRQGLILEYEREVRRLWWSRTVRRWFVREDDSVTALTVRRLGDALRAGKADERTTALLAVVHASGVHRGYFKDLDPRERERRITNLVGAHWVWRVARRGAAGVDPVM